MCTSPIKIKNGSRRYRDGIDKMFFRVPCGKCKECIERKKDDWFVRSYFEYLRCEKCGGQTFFPTFSYNNDNLPIWRDSDFIWNDKPFECPVFDPMHVKRFRDKLRIYLSREWYVKMINGENQYCSCGKTHSRIREKLIKEGYSLYWSPIDFSEGKNTIRFFISCEYGGDYGRSHLHGLLFVPFPITEDKMLFFLRKSWIYGFVMKSKKGLKVQSPNAVKYCMKYIEKPQKWFKSYGITQYKMYLEKQIDLVEKCDYLPFSNADLKLKEFTHLTPSHFQSIGFGYDMIPYLENNKDIVIDGRIDLSKLKFITKNRFKFQIPRYILRKLLVDKDEYNTDVPSSFSRQLFFERLEQMWLGDIQKLSYLQSYEAFKTHFSFLKMDDDTLNSHWKIVKVVSDKIPELVVYNSVYRDVPITENMSFFGYGMQAYMDSALDFAFQQKFNFATPVAKGDSVRDTKPSLFDSNRKTFGDLLCFHGFDNALRLIEELETILSREVSRAYNFKVEKMEQLWIPKNDVYTQYSPIY